MYVIKGGNKDSSSPTAISKFHISYLVIGLVIFVLAAIFVTLLIVDSSIKDIKQEYELLKLQNQNLIIFTEDKGRLIKVEELLFKETDAKTFLTDRIPIVAQRVLELSNKYKDDGLTVPTLMAIIEVESDFNPKAISKTPDGQTYIAYGLMQVVRSTATPILKDMGYTWSMSVILDPAINLEVGVRHLIDVHRQFVSMELEEQGEFHLSLLAYNKGEKTILESLDSHKRSSIALDYLGKVKIASRKWTNAGF